MDILNNLGWFGKSIAGMVSLIPLLVFYTTFIRFGIKPETIIFSWFLGVIIGILLVPFHLSLVKVPGFELRDLTPSLSVVIIVLAGITLGTIANLFLGQAMATAPNPAFPFAIVGSAGAVGYVVNYILSQVAPRYTEAVEFSWINFAGIVLLAISIGLIMYKQPAS